MTNTEFLYIICGLLVIIVLTTMASVHQTNAFGVIIIVLIGGYFIWKNLANPLLKKILIGLIIYVVAITIIGFVWSYQPSTDSGSKILINSLDLSGNKGSNIVKIPSNQMGKTPESNNYTYSFSMYAKEFNPTDPNLNLYIFYRNSAPNGNPNIGLRLGNTRETSTTLYLDYTKTIKTTTTTNGQTTTTTTEGVKATKTITTNIETRKWITITIVVNKKYIDVYFGDDLKDNFKIDDLESPSSSEPIQFGNIPVYLANFSYSSSLIPPTESIVKKLLLRTSNINTNI